MLPTRRHLVVRNRSGANFVCVSFQRSSSPWRLMGVYSQSNHLSVVDIYLYVLGVHRVVRRGENKEKWRLSPTASSPPGHARRRHTHAKKFRNFLLVCFARLNFSRDLQEISLFNFLFYLLKKKCLGSIFIFFFWFFSRIRTLELAGSRNNTHGQSCGS